MSSPLLYKAIYGAMALLTAVGVPAVVGWVALQQTGNVAVAVVVAAGVIYHTMALSLATLSVWEYVPDSLPLGPSFMAGHGLLSLGMTAAPLLVLPGLVWLYVLPVDEQGYVARGAAFSFDGDRLEAPHHAEVSGDD